MEIKNGWGEFIENIDIAFELVHSNKHDILLVSENENYRRRKGKVNC